MAVVASAMADSKTVAYLSYCVATRRQPVSLPNMTSIRLRRLYRLSSYLTSLLRCLQPGMQARIPLFFKDSVKKSAPYLRFPIDHDGLLFAMSCRQAGHHLREDALVTSSFPAVVQGPMWTIFLGRISPPYPLRLMNIIPVSTRRSPTRGLPWNFWKKSSRRAICASVSQKRSDMFTARF